MNQFNHQQSVAIALAPKLGAVPSIVGSSLILMDVFRQRKRDQARTPRDRILAGMSICDIVGSIAWFLSTWAIPKEFDGAVFNVGTQGTCTFQAFLTQWGVIGAVLYNGCLALYYLLLIRQGFTNKRVAKRIEPIMHCVAIGFATATSLGGLFLGIYNPREFGCYIAPFPRFCNMRQGVDCIRGRNAVFYRNLFWNYPVVAVIMFVFACMSLVFAKVRSVEKRAPRLQQSRLLRLVSIQCLLYTTAFLLCWTCSIALHIYWVINRRKRFWLMLLNRFFISSQGVFNATIYFLPFLRKIEVSFVGLEPIRAFQRRLSQNSSQFIHQRFSFFHSENATSERMSWLDHLRRNLKATSSARGKGQTSTERNFVQSQPYDTRESNETETTDHPTTRSSLLSNSVSAHPCQPDQPLTVEQIQSLMEISDIFIPALDKIGVVGKISNSTSNHFVDDENLNVIQQTSNRFGSSSPLPSNTQKGTCHKDEESSPKEWIDGKIEEKNPMLETDIDLAEFGTEAEPRREYLQQSAYPARRWSWLSMSPVSSLNSLPSHVNFEEKKTLRLPVSNRSSELILKEAAIIKQLLSSMEVDDEMTSCNCMVSRPGCTLQRRWSW